MLRSIREERGLSRAELSELSGVHRSTIWRIEAGFVNAHPDTIRILANALDRNPQELGLPEIEEEDGVFWQIIETGPYSRRCEPYYPDEGLAK